MAGPTIGSPEPALEPLEGAVLPPPGRWRAARRWLRLGWLVPITLGAQLLIRLPLPVLDDWLPLKNVLVAGAAVILGGKCLLDTFFYDRYWP